MPSLLLRGDSSTSLSALVEAALKRKTVPLPEYDIQLTDKHLELVLNKPTSYTNDEGFESDIDSLSLVSNDSFTIEKLGNTPNSKTIETDSANGSSSSDSDNDSEKIIEENGIESIATKPKECFDLVDCVCYTDVKSTDLLIFVIKNKTLVFKFVDVNELQKFYSNFTTLKAHANQKLYNKNFNTRFNLLQRTDQNGITHIRVTREAELNSLKKPENNTSNIITINTPENVNNNNVKANKNRDVNSRQRISPDCTENSKLVKSNSTDSILELNLDKQVKVWNSAEDLLDAPKRPERRKKGKAPQPPALQKDQNVFSGQYVRVNVNIDSKKDEDAKKLIMKSSLNEPHPKKLQSYNMFGSKPSLASLLKKEKTVLRYQPKLSETTNYSSNPLSIDYNSWTNSVPRTTKKPKPKSEVKNPTPMAYRYIDTIPDYPLAYGKEHANNFIKNHPVPIFGHNNASFSNYLKDNQNFNGRLFGMSSKLKEFQHEKDNVWKTNSSEITGLNKDNNNLKSVIKVNKDDNNKKKNDKKVTFSAYTTVQVV